jgi:diguanylate cyclase (GGDEF)-like protein/hemerythrin-like metal-binding protein/PAS domain S-box-containing protein
MRMPVRSGKTPVRKNASHSSKKIEDERLRVAFELVTFGIGLIDQDGKFTDVNRALSEMFGLEKQEMIGMLLSDLPVPEEDAPVEIPDKLGLNGDSAPVVLERRFVSRRGRILWVEVSIAYDARTSKAASFVASFQAITKRKLLQFALEEQASIDTLTKALNRATFSVRASIELLRAERNGHELSMVMADLDHFKEINDTCGHAAGDQVLSIFGDVTRECLRIGDILCRWGGEEFLILLPETGPVGAQQVAERIRKALEVSSVPCAARVTASLGVVTMRSGEGLATLVERADGAMYQAKQTGRNRVFTNSDDLAREAKGDFDRLHLLQLYWRRHYECGIPEIDVEHMKLFKIANRIQASLSSNGTSSEAVPLVDELLVHIAQHFKHEEKILRQSRYPMVRAHSLSHSRLLERADVLAAEFRDQGMTAGAVLGFVIHDVVARHVALEDREYFPWMKRHDPDNGRARGRRETP